MKRVLSKSYMLSKMFVRGMAEASVLGLVVTVGAVGLLTLCGVCEVNWSVFRW